MHTEPAAGGDCCQRGAGGTLVPVPVLEDDGDPRPGLTLFPEYGVDVPVWHGPDSDATGLVDADQLLALGVSPALVERLAAWQEALSRPTRSGSGGAQPPNA